MENLFVFTASRPEAYQHYIDTIENGFDLVSVKDCLSYEDFNKLSSIYQDKKVRAWGSTPGEGNIRTWEKMNIGDPVLIYRKGNFEYYAFVTHKIHNKELANNLWRENDLGQTWEYVYFLDNLVEISVPVSTFNDLMGFQSNYNPQGFARISEERKDSLIERFGSIDKFLDYLSEGQWVKRDNSIPEEMKENIIRERISRQTGRTQILEANLENILVESVDKIESGLILVRRQLDTREVGRLDLLCKDQEGNFVVVELKRGVAPASIIDQIQRYMGWIIKHCAKESQKVRGIIIVGTRDTVLDYAVAANPLVSVKEFSISIQ